MKKTFLRHRVITTLATILMAFSFLPAKAQVKNIVLVHGAFADGSGWARIYKILTSRSKWLFLV